jgi:hypothetical protein
VRDLTGQQNAPVSHPPMLGAGDLYRAPASAMTAPQNQSVAYDGWEPGPQHPVTSVPDAMPIGNPPRLGEVASHDGGFDRSTWVDADDLAGPGLWEQVP